jgi:hypothetical protein
MPHREVIARSYFEASIEDCRKASEYVVSTRW